MKKKPFKTEDAVLRQWLYGLGPFRNQINQIVLFGSRARGTARPDSDYDLLLVVSKREQSLVDRCHDSAMDTLFATGRLVSPKILSVEEFNRLNRLRTPFMQEVEKEGIEID